MGRKEKQVTYVDIIHERMRRN